MNIDKFNNISSLLALTQVQAANNAANLNTSETEEDWVKIESDSFAKSEAFPIVSGMYTSSGREIEGEKIPQIDVESEQVDTKANNSDNTAAAGGAGGGSGGSSEEETTTQIITINGVTYLETTTTSDGVSTVTRRVIGSSEA